MLIAFEGPDGAGSSTQSKLLAERLNQEGRKAILTKEPTPSEPIGTLIRAILQHKHKASPQALQLLFCADRAQHLADEIEPALREGTIVVSDRYILSTIAYGSLSLAPDWLEKINSDFRQADLTFLMDLPERECLERIHGRGGEFELFETQDRLRKIRSHYLQLAKIHPGIHVLDASQSIERVHEEVWEILKGARA